MKNKKLILIITLIVLFISFICVGASIWIISSKTVIKPQNATKEVVKKYLELSCNDALEYNGKIQLPRHSKLDTNELKYYYKDASGAFVKVTNTDGPKNAGTYEIQVRYTKTNDTGISEEITITLEQGFTISPKELSLTWSNTSFTHDGNPHLPTATLNPGLIAGDTCNVSVSVNGYPNGPTEVGTYTATATVDNSNYTLSNSSTTFRIKSLKKVLSIEADDVQTTTYTGSLQNPTISNVYLQTVDDENNPVGEPTILDSSQYTLSYTYTLGIEPINSSLYNVVITATYNSSSSDVENGTKNIEFEIYKRDITIEWSYVSAAYDGAMHSPVASLTYTDDVSQPGVLIVDKDNCGINVTGEINAGNHTSTAKLVGGKAGNYSIANGNYDFTIEKANPVVTWPSYYHDNIIEGEKPTIKTNGSATFTPKGQSEKKVEGIFEDNINDVNIFSEDNATSPTCVVSATLTFIPTGDSKTNFNSVEFTKEFTIYAVAFNSSTSKYYGTIEKAIDNVASNNKIWVVPDIYKNTGFYPTLKNDKTIESGITLGLTYIKSDNTPDYDTGYKVFSNGDAVADINDGVMGSMACIKEGVNLTVYGILSIGAYVNSNSSVSRRSVLMNNGTINLMSGSKTYAYGYIKGTSGIVNSNNGAKVYDLLRIYDFPGARYAPGMYYKAYSISSRRRTYNNIFPFNTFSLHNISCELNIYNGSTYYARYQLNVSNEMYTGEIPMFGTGGFISINSTNGYIKRTIEDSVNNTKINESYTTTNQDLYQKEIYDVYSNITDNVINVSMSIKNLISIDIQTSTDLAMPIGFMEFRLKSGFTAKFSKNSYKFLPGSKITVDNGAKLTIDSQCKMIFYDNYYDNFKSIDQNGTETSPASYSYYIKHKKIYASDNSVLEQYKPKLIIHGELEVNGYLGGLIDATQVGGKITIINPSATLNRLQSIKYLDIDAGTIAGAILTTIDFGGTVYSDTQYLRAKILSGSSVSDFTNLSTGTYYCVEKNGEFCWSTTAPSTNSIVSEVNSYSIVQQGIRNILYDNRHIIKKKKFQ